MVHPLVAHLRFTRGEWLRGLEGVTDEEGARRFGEMNTIGWLVGHLAWHEQFYWLDLAQGQLLVPEARTCAGGQPASRPKLSEMLAGWRTIVEASEGYLDRLDARALARHWEFNGRPSRENIGTALHRITYHYWYHLGEMQAIRQLLGHAELPTYVGNLASVAFQLEPPDAAG
ncbi:MAG: DinB family protein [Thermomicrobiales bacterium]